MYTCVSSVSKFATCEQLRCAILRATMEAWFWSCTSGDECKTREPSANDRLILLKDENGLEEYRGPRAPLVCCHALVRVDRAREFVIPGPESAASLLSCLVRKPTRNVSYDFIAARLLHTVSRSCFICFAPEMPAATACVCWQRICVSRPLCLLVRPCRGLTSQRLCTCSATCVGVVCV